MDIISPILRRSFPFRAIAKLKPEHDAPGVAAPPDYDSAMDADNAVARHKPILDWLKARGYIADDRRKCLRWEDFPEQIVRRNGDYRIELTITPITE